MKAFFGIFFVLFSRKTFWETDTMFRKCWGKKANTRRLHPGTPSGFEPDKALAKWMWKRGLADTGLDSGSAA